MISNILSSVLVKSVLVKIAVDERLRTLILMNFKIIRFKLTRMVCFIQRISSISETKRDHRINYHTLRALQKIIKPLKRDDEFSNVWRVLNACAIERFSMFDNINQTVSSHSHNFEAYL